MSRVGEEQLLKIRLLFWRIARVTRRFVLLIWIPVLAFVAYTGWYTRDLLIPYLVAANYSKLLIAFLFYICALSAVVLGWTAIMRALVGPIGRWMHVQIYCATLAARRLPGTVWYIGGRMVLYERLGISKVIVSVATGIELVVSIVSGILVGIILMPFGVALSWQMTAILVIGALLGALTLHPVVLNEIMHRLGRPLTSAITLRDTFSWFCWYAGMWLLGGAMLVEIVGAFNPLTWQEMIWIIGAWALSGAVGVMTLPLPSTFGATELALGVFLSQIMPVPLAAAIAILTRLLTTVFEVALAGAFHFILRRSEGMIFNPLE